jgi:Na+-driven multidrug efflux pump
VALAPQIVAIYTADPVIAVDAVACLRIVSIGFVFFAYGMVLTQAFNGAGDAWTPTWINIACFWVWQLPLAYGLALGVGMGPSGVYWAVMIAFSTLALVSAVIFKRGHWKRQQV